MALIISTSIDKLAAATRKLKDEKLFYDNLKTQDLYPHAGQKLVLKILFRYNKKDVFLQCGRNFGKSHCMALWALLYAIMNPNKRVYIIAPLRQQGYEIYCASGLLKSMIPDKFLINGSWDDSYNKSELRISLANGSFVKVEGADNEDSLRGIKPHALGCDEFQSWKDGVYDIMEPNLLAHDATVFKIGTPPDRENDFIKNGRFVEAQQKGGNKRFFYMRQPTSANPRISREQLALIKRRYIERGEEEVYTREYEAIFIPGGASAIFKTFNPDHHVRPRDWIYSRLERDLHKCEMWTVCDPGSTSVFAVGFFIINRYTGEVFLVDEIYEKDDKYTSTGQIWGKVQAKEAERFNSTPIRFYDEAAAWFAKELANQFPNDCAITPTNKKSYERDSQFNADSCSVVKDAFLLNKFYIAEECINAIQEVTNYHKNDRGMIAANQFDHLVDCIRYFFHESGWSISLSISQKVDNDKRNFTTPQEDFYNQRMFKSDEEQAFIPNSVMPQTEIEISDLDIEDTFWN